MYVFIRMITGQNRIKIMFCELSCDEGADCSNTLEHEKWQLNAPLWKQFVCIQMNWLILFIYFYQTASLSLNTWQRPSQLYSACTHARISLLMVSGSTTHYKIIQTGLHHGGPPLSTLVAPCRASSAAQNSL